MSKSRVALLLLSCLLVSPGFTPAEAKERTLKKAGPSSVNTILSGSGKPSNKLGRNGDFYIDIESLVFYGPKKNNKWPNGIPMRVMTTQSASTGATGASGDKGEKGEKGEKGPAGPAGPVGPAGPAGPAGAKGDVGPAGPKGDTGPAGAKGDTGATGLQGPKGDTGDTGPKGDKGDTGAKGDTGLTGATGSQGAQGIQGPKGDKGDSGASGQTNAASYSIAFGSWIQTSNLKAYYANFNSLSGITARKTYAVDMTVYVVRPAGVTTSAAVEFSLQSDDSCASVDYFYSGSFGQVSRDVSPSYESAVAVKAWIDASLCSSNPTISGRFTLYATESNNSIRGRFIAVEVAGNWIRA